MGSIYFVGFATSAGIVSPMADTYGRKSIVFMSMLIHLVGYTAIILSKNIYVVLFCYLILGLCAGGRICVGSLYFNEFFPTRHQNIFTSLYNAADGSVMLI